VPRSERDPGIVGTRAEKGASEAGRTYDERMSFNGEDDSRTDPGAMMNPDYTEGPVS